VKMHTTRALPQRPIQGHPHHLWFMLYYLALNSNFVNV
jgi:hypothetical protein